MILKGMVHRHVMQLLGAHASDTEKPMLLFPKTMHGTLKDLLLHTREQRRGAMVGVAGGCGWLLSISMFSLIYRHVLYCS